MSTLLSAIALLTVASVVFALVRVLWRQRTLPRDTWIAVAAGAVLVLWAGVIVTLARANVFEASPTEGPPIGRAIGLALLALFVVLAASRSLRRLLSRQESIIRLHLWRFFGVVFITLMAFGKLPALFALPAGIGDILIGATARSVARTVDAPGGKRRAILFNSLGMLDLIVAAFLGITTNVGRAHVFDTVPTSEILTHFPMALVPAFLVPLAFTLHVVSLWQLLRHSWAARTAER
jgi:hypothetical protein